MRLSWIAASMLVGLMLLAPAANAQQKVAVVRVGDVVSNMAEGKKAAQAATARDTDAKQEGARKQQELQTLEGSLQQLKRGSQQWMQTRDQLEDKQLANQVWAKKMEITLGRAAKDDVRRMFDHVTEATQQVAQEQHINLVMADNSPDIGPNVDQLTVQQFASVLAQRNVLFADKTVDITQDVLTRVDAIYAKQNQGAASPAPAPSAGQK